MKHLVAFAVALLFACFVEAAAEETVPVGEAAAVRLSPADHVYWRTDFSWETPATQLDFVRQSNKRRPERLKVIGEHFEVFSTEESDAIRRKDGAAFNAVSILEPISIENPPAGYLPFAQFGDGGLLLHTGRFHACAGPCPTDDNQNEGPWRVAIDPGEDGRMILNGAVETGLASFVDTGDGTKVYIGDGEIISSKSLLAVIDAALPDTVVESLNRLLPPLMDYYGERLGKLREKQMLFASYNVPGDVRGSSIKGGTLPRQVFMHFEGDKIPEFSSEADFPYFLAWFFAHEAAHLHQRHRFAQYDNADSWIHEGVADAMAYLALQEMDAAPDAYLAKRLDRARTACADALAGGSLRSVLERDAPFQAYYDCGLIIHLAADAAARRGSGADLFGVWKTFIQRVGDGAPWNTETYLRVVSEAADEETADFIEEVAEGRIDDPVAALRIGLTASGFEPLLVE